MKSIKKYFYFFLAFMLVINSLIPISTLSATETAGTGSISGKIKIWGNEEVRENINGKGSIPGQNNLADYDQVGVKLLNEAGEEIAKVYSGQSTESGKFSFEGLADGSYYVEIEDESSAHVRHVILPGDSNFFLDVKLQKQNRSEKFTIVNGQAITDVTYVVIRRPYAFEVSTAVGEYHYTNNGEARVGKEFAYYNGGAVSFPYSGRNYTTVLGVLHSDKMANITDTLPIPVLSEEERDYGWEFFGWTPNDKMLDSGNYPELSKGMILPTSTVLNLVAKGDMSFRAVFKAPVHDVRFATDAEKGGIEYTADNNEKLETSYITYSVEGNTKKVGSITLPNVVAKEGYEFIGWYADPTTNVIPTEELKNIPVRSDLNFYAKYRQIDKGRSKTPVVSSLIEDNNIITGTGVAGSNIEIILPDGSTANVTVGDNGEWNYNSGKLVSGDIYTFIQTEKGKEESRNIAGTVIRKTEETSENPIVDKIVEGDLVVTGLGVANSNIIITLKDGSKIATSVQANGKWSAIIPEDKALERGDIVSVIQIETDKKASSSVDATVIEKKIEKSANPTIFKVTEGDKILNGLGVPGSKITINFKDLTSVETMVTEDGKWTVAVPKEITIEKGDVISSVQTEEGKLPSSSVDATAIEKDKPSNVDSDDKNNSSNNGGDSSSDKNGSDESSSSDNKDSSNNEGDNSSSNSVEKQSDSINKTNRISKDKSPKTGDYSANVIFATLMVLSALTFVTARKKIKDK